QRTGDWLQGAGAEGSARAVLTLADAHYPPALLATEDPPPLLYLMGAARFVGGGQPFAPARSLAVVGSRNPTAQGAQHARQFARALHGAGLCIVLGLPRGVE